MTHINKCIGCDGGFVNRPPVNQGYYYLLHQECQQVVQELQHEALQHVGKQGTLHNPVVQWQDHLITALFLQLSPTEQRLSLDELVVKYSPFSFAASTWDESVGKGKISALFLGIAIETLDIQASQTRENR